MNRSESIGTLAKALAKAQGQIKAAVKGAENPFFKSSYADLPAVFKACREHLSANDIAVIQATGFDEAGVFLETTLAHASGEWVSGVYPVRPVKPDPQSMGSAITYSRRYALSAMVGVVADDEDDDGARASGNVASSAMHNSPTFKDKDVEDGVKNWCDKQKAFLANCDTVAEVTDWEELQADALRRLKSKALPSWSELMKVKEARIGNINLAGLEPGSKG